MTAREHATEGRPIHTDDQLVLAICKLFASLSAEGISRVHSRYSILSYHYTLYRTTAQGSLMQKLLRIARANCKTVKM